MYSLYAFFLRSSKPHHVLHRMSICTSIDVKCKYWEIMSFIIPINQ